MTTSATEDRRLEERLLRFLDDGDTRALGEIFDATSPELFRIAQGLLHDPASAEDALSETWLSALDSLDRFDRSRRVMPWLVGILRNKAATIRFKA